MQRRARPRSGRRDTGAPAAPCSRPREAFQTGSQKRRTTSASAGDSDLRARPDASPDQVWHAHLDGVRRILADRDFATEKFDGYFGPTTVEDLLANFYGFDMSVHRWDLGRSTGQDVTFEDAEMDALEAGIDGLGDSLYGDGVCKPPLEVPDDAPRQTRILGRLGRRA